MALVSLPALTGLFEGVDWTLEVPQQKNRSEFTSRTQVIGLPGAEQWRATAMVLPEATETQFRLWRAFILACRGSENTFQLPAPRPWPTPASQPTVTTAVAGNRAVVVSSAAQLAIGMCATVQQTNGHYRLVGVVGIAGTTVSFEPYLTANPSIGATLSIIAPFCPVRLSSNSIALPNRARPTGFRFEAEEDL